MPNILEGVKIELHPVHVHGPEIRPVHRQIRDQICSKVGTIGISAVPELDSRVHSAGSKLVCIKKVVLNGSDTAVEFQSDETVVAVSLVGTKVEIRKEHQSSTPWVVLSPLWSHFATEGHDETSFPRPDMVSWLLWPTTCSVQQLVIAMGDLGSICCDFYSTWRLDKQVIAVGSCGAVHKATRIDDVHPHGYPHVLGDHDALECVAVKIVPFDKHQKLRREIAILAALRGHPNVIYLHCLVHMHQGKHAFGVILPFCDKDLYSEVADSGCLSEFRATSIMVDLASALDYVHGSGILHRDVKPENVFLLSGKCLLGDFDTAIYLNDRVALMNNAGTVGYMAPEVWMHDFNACGYPMDIFSTGVLLYFLISAAMPFGDDRDRQTAFHLTLAMRVKFRRPQSKTIKNLIRSMCSSHRDRPTARDVKNACLRFSRRLFRNDAQGSDIRHGNGATEGLSGISYELSSAEASHPEERTQALPLTSPSSSSSNPAPQASHAQHDEVLRATRAALRTSRLGAASSSTSQGGNEQRRERRLPSLQLPPARAPENYSRSFTCNPRLERGGVQATNDQRSRQSSKDAVFQSALPQHDVHRAEPAFPPRSSHQKIASSLFESAPPRLDVWSNELQPAKFPSRVPLSQAEAEPSGASSNGFAASASGRPAAPKIVNPASGSSPTSDVTIEPRAPREPQPSISRPSMSQFVVPKVLASGGQTNGQRSSSSSAAVQPPDAKAEAAAADQTQAHVTPQAPSENVERSRQYRRPRPPLRQRSDLQAESPHLAPPLDEDEEDQSPCGAAADVEAGCSTKE
eukprot:TRINITY_DN9391_c0_g3_i1.p1 TRINITY_DN9391_c0_g3~~TRINITY_DN9391_c0_g3_i1.p1  ORF type:complete len:802 (-),score=92.64 TRINITY_DN9391_c0_g3_i1:25-2430(-)